jgi:hypothetical protein
MYWPVLVLYGLSLEVGKMQSVSELPDGCRTSMIDARKYEVRQKRREECAE